MQLPEGYSMRPATWDDEATVLKLFRAVSVAVWGQDEVEEDDVKGSWKTPNFDLEKSTRLVLNEKNEVIAYLSVWDLDEKPVYPGIGIRVHPDYWDQLIDKVLFAWGIERTLEVVDRCPPDVRIALRAGAKAEFEPAEKLYKHFGFEPVRHWYNMIIDYQDNPPQPQIPEGITIRPFRYPEEFHDVIRADNDGFRDHWGFVEQPFEEELKYWTHWVESDPEFDPNLWFIAVDDASGEIAGVCLCRRIVDNNPDKAYVDSLAVRRQYRKRGLGLAMLQHAFNVFWGQGKKYVSLGVDASSLTGALDLYKRAGMRVDQKSTTWEKVVREGVELSTVEA